MKLSGFCGGVYMHYMTNPLMYKYFAVLWCLQPRKMMIEMMHKETQLHFILLSSPTQTLKDFCAFMFTNSSTTAATRYLWYQIIVFFMHCIVRDFEEYDT